MKITLSLPRTCPCKCHANHDDTAWKYGVDSRDFVACIMACDECRRNHERVLYDDDPPSKPLPRGDTSTAWTEQGDGEGRE